MGLTKTKVARENYTVDTILEAFSQGLLRDDHPLQRHAHQHSNSYRDGFISSVIKNEDFDSIKMCEQTIDSTTILWLIDGMQRISEIREYRNGAFKLGRTIESPTIEYQIPKQDENGMEIKDENGNPVYETVLVDLRGKFYSDLPKAVQLQFNNCPIDVVKHLDCTNDDIAYHIRRYNRQTTMNGAQTSVTYAEKRAAQIKKIATNNKFFLDCGNYTAKDRKSGAIDRVIMESVMSTFHLEDWKKQANRMGQYINNNVSAEEFEILDGYFHRLYGIAEGKYPDIFNAKNTFVFMPVFHKFTRMGMPDEKFGEFLDAFVGGLCDVKVNGCSYNELLENRATKDKTVIMQKINLLNALMKDYFGVEKCDIEPSNDVDFVAEMTGCDKDEVAANMNFYYQCLDDTMDRVVAIDSKLRDKSNRLPLVSLLIHAYQTESDELLEPWMEWYGKLAFPNDTYTHLLMSFENYGQKIA